MFGVQIRMAKFDVSLKSYPRDFPDSEKMVDSGDWVVTGISTTP